MAPRLPVRQQAAVTVIRLALGPVSVTVSGCFKVPAGGSCWRAAGHVPSHGIASKFGEFPAYRSQLASHTGSHTGSHGHSERAWARVLLAVSDSESKSAPNWVLISGRGFEVRPLGGRPAML